ncbi:hypothetical protein RND81_03G140600 [Saponaria officinalis]|uniref:Uncharacterized protein n=1 Tax=Saponaria officinalis TaxID=3572 RepID=A0AAW1M3N1_SAPOF
MNSFFTTRIINLHKSMESFSLILPPFKSKCPICFFTFVEANVGTIISIVLQYIKLYSLLLTMFFPLSFLVHFVMFFPFFFFVQNEWLLLFVTPLFFSTFILYHILSFS